MEIRCEDPRSSEARTARDSVLEFQSLSGFEGVSEGKICFNDLATGPRRVTVDELGASFTGVVLVLGPGKFQPGGDKPSFFSSTPAFARIRNGTRARGGRGNAPHPANVVNPAFTKTFIDDFLVSEKNDVVRPLLVGWQSVALMTVLLLLQRHFLLRLQTKLALTTSAKFLIHVIQLPMEFFSQRYAGEIGSRVLINDKVAKVLSEKLATTLLDMMSLVFFASHLSGMTPG